MLWIFFEWSIKSVSIVCQFSSALVASRISVSFVLPFFLIFGEGNE